jgi:hypothetical protein
MSTGMWKFVTDSELFFEQLINKLLRETIARRTASSVSHSVKTMPAIHVDLHTRRYFEDFYKVWSCSASLTKRRC